MGWKTRATPNQSQLARARFHELCAGYMKLLYSLIGSLPSLAGVIDGFRFLVRIDFLLQFASSFDDLTATRIS